MTLGLGSRTKLSNSFMLSTHFTDYWNYLFYVLLKTIKMNNRVSKIIVLSKIPFSCLLFLLIRNWWCYSLELSISSFLKGRKSSVIYDHIKTTTTIHYPKMLYHHSTFQWARPLHSYIFPHLPCVYRNKFCRILVVCIGRGTWCHI